jgi:hypothetical protein
MHRNLFQIKEEDRPNSLKLLMPNHQVLSIYRQIASFAWITLRFRLSASSHKLWKLCTNWCSHVCSDKWVAAASRQHWFWLALYYRMHWSCEQDVKCFHFADQIFQTLCSHLDGPKINDIFSMSRLFSQLKLIFYDSIILFSSYKNLTPYLWCNWTLMN